MAWFHGDDVAANARRKKREVADDIEDFVPDEFIGETERLLAQNRLASHDDGVLETATFDQVFFHERLDVFVENKRARRCDLALENGGRNLRGEKLREASPWSDLGAGDAILLIRQDDEQRAAFRLDVDWLAHSKRLPQLLLRGETRLPDDLDVRLRTTVADGRFIGVHLD